MIKTIEQLNLSESMHSYAQQITRTDQREYDSIFEARHGKMVNHGFIEWGDNPCAWSGPWDEKHVLFYILDFSKCLGMYSERTIRSMMRDEAEFSVYVYPARFREAIYNSKETPGRSRISREERDRIHSEMTLAEHSTVADLLAWTETEDFDIRNRQSIERPVKICLTGTDDFDLRCLVSSVEKANDMIENIAKTQSFASLYNEFGFSPN